MRTISQIRKNSGLLLPASPTPALDVECILSHILRTPKSALLSHDERPLTRREESAFDAALKKRQNGLPVAYIVGKKEFFAIDFFVNKNVLIPKPDTELLVEKALEAALVAIRNCTGKIRIADVCTGSGCIALAVLKSLNDEQAKKIELVASDISRSALRIAKKNAKVLLGGLPQKNCIRFVHSNLLKFAKLKIFDIITANPPYIPLDDARLLLKDGRNEPLLALSGGKGDGTEIIANLVAEAASALKTGGLLFLEIGSEQAKPVTSLFEAAHFTDIKIHHDLGGMPRVIQGKLGGKNQ